MSIRNWFGLVVAGGIAAVVAGGCSSSNTPAAPSDGGDGIGHLHLDSGTADMDAAGIGVGDGTTGKACKTDTDCVSPTGPGTNKCSNYSDGMLTIENVPVAVWATPVCIIPLPVPGAATGNCDPTAPGGFDD